MHVSNLSTCKILVYVNSKNNHIDLVQSSGADIKLAVMIGNRLADTSSGFVHDAILKYYTMDIPIDQRTGKWSELLYRDFSTKYYPSSRSTFRIGTLSGYRKIKDIARRDDEESFFTIRYNFSPDYAYSIDSLFDLLFQSYPKEMIGSHEARYNLTRSFAHVGEFTGEVFGADNYELVERSGEMLRLKGTIELHFRGPDAFVCCLHCGSENDSVIDTSEPTTRGRFYASRLSEVAGIMSKYLLGELRNGDCLTQSSVWQNSHAMKFPKSTKKEHVSVGIRSRSVIYHDREIFVEGDLTGSKAEAMRLVRNSPFVKPLRFAHENEYRLLFRPMVIKDKRVYMFPNELKVTDIPAAELAELFEVDPTTATVAG